MITLFKQNIQQLSIHKGHSILIAVSGGVDSMVLTHLAMQYFDHVYIAHCNFHLRGEESDRDENFVRKFARENQIPIYVNHFNTQEWANAHNCSIQEAARSLRYDWFADILDGKVMPNENLSDSFYRPQYLFTAHHGDDQIETFFIHLNRGSGIKGLKGILPKQQKIIRPLLNFTKKQLIEYAQENQLSYVEDSSNESDKYTRNFFRLHIIPLIESKFPGFGTSVLHNIERLQGGYELYQMKVSELIQDLVVLENNEIHIPIRKLLKLPAYKTILWELVEPHGFSSAQLNDIIDLKEAQSGKFIASATHQIFKHREWLKIVEKGSPNQQHILIDDLGEFSFSLGQLVCKEKDFDGTISTDPHLIQLDRSLIEFPFIIRKWKEGDYFYPLGMKKKKKVSRFLMDQKLSKSDKEQVWVVEMNQKIIWVIGLRIDDRFKLLPKTEKTIELQFIKN